MMQQNDFSMPSDIQSMLGPSLGQQEAPTGAPAGMIGSPQQPQQPQQRAPGEIQSVVSNELQANPEIVARVRAGIDAGLQSGELTQQELDTVVQLATVSLDNPDMYPQARMFAIQQGIADEGDIPEQYDEGLLAVLMVVGNSMKADVQMDGAPGQQLPQQQPQLGQPPQEQQTPQQLPQGQIPIQQAPKLSMREGGQVDPRANPGAVMGTGLSMPMRNKPQSYSTVLHQGEYVIPDKVVRAKGTDFFDALLEKSNKPKTGKQ